MFIYCHCNKYYSMSFVQETEFIIKNNGFKIRDPKYTGNEEKLVQHFENLQYRDEWTFKNIEPCIKFSGMINTLFNDNKTNYQEIINNIGNINSPYVGSDGFRKSKFRKLLDNKKFLFKILNLYNQIITNKNYKLAPTWSDLLNVPRYKKNETNIPKNFRILSLINTTTKIFNKIVKSRILDYLHSNNIFNTNIQQGNMKGLNGLVTLNKRIELISRNAIKDNEKFDIIFLDLKNAYGSVDLNDALFVLKYYKVSEWVITYITNYYKSMNHKLMLSHKDKILDIKINFGLITGCGLSEGLFLIVMNYIFEKMIEKFGNDNFNQAYVDDICIWGYGKELQEKLTYLNKLVLKFSMKFGIEKCRVKHVNKSSYKYKINDEYIPELKKEEIFKYLGYIKGYGNNKKETYQLIKIDFIKDIFERYNKMEYCKKYFKEKNKYKDEIIDKAYVNYKSRNILFFFMNSYKKYSKEFPYIIDLIIDFGNKLFGFENMFILDKIKEWEKNNNITYIKYGEKDKLCSKYDMKYIETIKDFYGPDVIQNNDTIKKGHNNHGDYLNI